MLNSGSLKQYPAFPSRQIQLPAFGFIDVPVLLSGPDNRFFRETVSFRFSPAGSPDQTPARLEFQFTPPFQIEHFLSWDLHGRLPESRTTDNGSLACDVHSIDGSSEFAETRSHGPWLAVNGLQVSSPGRLPEDTSAFALSRPWTFQLLHPEELGKTPMAITRIGAR